MWKKYEKPKKVGKYENFRNLCSTKNFGSEIVEFSTEEEAVLSVRFTYANSESGFDVSPYS